LLHEEGFSLQGNAKTLEGRQHRDRDAQFRYINEQVKTYQGAGEPVVSVDTKKKELVGQFGNGGREWRPKGEPAEVATHDFPDPGLGKAIPYGVYDVAANAGWVSVGTDHDTAAFAVESIRRWWKAAGRGDYPRARRLLITADAGGSNSYRTRAWKAELAAFALEAGLAVTVCHFPPGTSKWNKIEHRLFSHITMNWRGRPLASHEVIVNTIAATTAQFTPRPRTQQLGPPRPDRPDQHPMGPADQHPDHHPPGPAPHPPLHTPRRPAHPQTSRRAPTRPHHRRENPGHPAAPAFPPAQARARRTLRSRPQHHHQRRTPDLAPAHPGRLLHRTSRAPAHHPDRPHPIRPSPRPRPDSQTQTSVLIIYKL
jgi:hypothetical protein